MLMLLTLSESQAEEKSDPDNSDHVIHFKPFHAFKLSFNGLRMRPFKLQQLDEDYQALAAFGRDG
jgi:hypothetical protein